MTLWIITALALLNGGWMIFDGLYVIKYGKFFGSEMPGPWRIIVETIGLDPFKMGPFFITLGSAWLIALIFHHTQSWNVPLVIIALATIWYIPFGTLISILVLSLAMFNA